MQRGFGTSNSHRRRPLYGLVAAIVLVALLSMQAGTLARLQATLDGPSPATGHASVIAQGVSEIPFDPIAWRVVRDTAEPLDVAPPVERALGFVVAESDGVHVADQTYGMQQRLAPGEASFVAESAIQIRASLTDFDTSYLRIALVAEGDASDPGNDELVFGGQGFSAPDGRRDIDLVRDVLDLDEESDLAGGDYPVLVMAIAGSLEVYADGQSVPLQTGEATEFTGDLTMIGLQDGSAYIAGVIGPEVPVPPRSSGTITISVSLCGPDLTPEDLGDPLDEGVATACEPISEDLEVSLEAPDGEELTLDDAETVRAGTYAWIGLPFGDYSIARPTALPANSGDPTFYDSDGNLLASTDITIDRDSPDVHVDLFAFQSGTGAGVGSLAVTVYACPSGWTPESGDRAACEVMIEGFGLTVSTTSQGNGTLTLEDAELRGDQYVWTGLNVSPDSETYTEGYYVVSESPLPDGYNAYITTADSQGGINLTVNTPDGEVALYNWVNTNPTGTITVDTVVCPSAQSGPQECSRQFGPGGLSGIYIQDVDGEYSALTDGNASREGDGPYVWASLPYGSYFMDTSGLVPPQGYTVLGVVLTPDGSSVDAGFTIDEDVSIANIVVLLTPINGGEEPPPVDSDNDGLTDEGETSSGTDSFNPDTDGDCHSDGAEVTAGTDPLDAASYPAGDCDVAIATEARA